MPYDRNGDGPPAKGDSRTRSQASKRGTEGAASKSKINKPSQKAMLSRALQKANTAVQLDNAQNFDGARQSYLEACDLLQQVLQRTGAEEDKRKLEAIRKTYTSRIEELDQMDLDELADGKALPARPESTGYPPSVIRIDGDDFDDIPIIETATVTKIGPVLTPDAGARLRPKQLQSSFSRSPQKDWSGSDGFVLQRPEEDRYMPPPLSPRRPDSPTKTVERGPTDPPARPDFSAMMMDGQRSNGINGDHARTMSKESNSSWLDGAGGSAGSTGSSVHSRSSSTGIRRKHIRAASGDTEAEFDAALDAAVEAAYDDGFEPAEYDEIEPAETDEDRVARALRKVELAKERVRQTERETLELERERERRRNLQQAQESPAIPDFYDDGSSDDGERMLEEMTQGYEIEDFAFSSQPGPALPRESDSSIQTSRTWYSSMASNPPTATTTLSTVSEAGTAISFTKPNYGAPPPDQSLPDLPLQFAQAGPPSSTNQASQSVRNRRLSGQNPKQLKIETSKLGRAQNGSSTKDGARDQQSDLPLGAVALADSPTRPGRRSPTGYPADYEEDGINGGRAESPISHPALRNNYSSSSLRSAKSRNMSVSNLDDASDLSPGTPSSNQFGSTSRLPTFNAIPTPLAAAFRDQLNGDPAENVYLFDGNFHSPNSPGSPNHLMVDAPVPLEACPTDFLLRPFWLMRCLYQTLAHSRGGYLSSKLFVPRDVWRVKGAKLRNLEDKIATCDYLTAALLKLKQVNSCDADAVLEEMQSLETVLDLMTNSLTKKLGNEVGVQSPGLLFKESANGADADAAANVPRSASVSGKSSASFSWRRLRTKNSAVGLAGSYNGRGDAGKDSPITESLPMTSHPTSRPAKRDISQVQFSGPQAGYMESLARLFDAAQTVDQIARQVEDPGLRHADKTQVGLELCTRHAAEFFAFYICRFVLGDLNILMDKFIKRGSEWIMT